MTTKKSTLLLSALSLGLLMAGCQSMPSVTSSPQNTNAKAELEQALRAQLRSVFSYHTSLKLSTHDGDVKEKYCGEIHDEAYVALAEEAHAAGLDISADRYIEARARLKDDYLACEEKERAAYEVFYGSMLTDIDPHDWTATDEAKMSLTSDEAALGESDDGVITSEAEALALIADVERIAETQGNQAGDDSAKTAEERDIPEYERALITKRTALIDTHLIRPLTLEMTGNYQPLKGVVTALPSLSYRAKNITAMVNQPVYIDLKGQAVYLWADNFAIANTQLDKKLGLAWQNKWLKLPINDGSLPESFAEDLLSHYLQARKEAFDDSPKVSYRYVEADAYPANMSAAKVIAHTDASVLQHEILVNFFSKMIESYPELLEKVSQDDEVRINSKFMMQRMFDLMSHRVTKVPEFPSTVTAYYGLDGAGRLTWIYQDMDRAFFDNKLKLDALVTQFHPSTQATPFPRLPSAHALPTPENSVDLLAYGDALITRLKDNGDFGGWFGRTLLAVLLGDDAHRILLGDTDDYMGEYGEYDDHACTAPEATTEDDVRACIGMTAGECAAAAAATTEATDMDSNDF